MFIDTAFIIFQGEPSVGESQHVVTISDLGLDLGVLDPSEVKPALEEFRADIQNTFGKAYDEVPKVMFDFEVPAEAGEV